MNDTETTRAEITHACPREGESVTLCCGRNPFELPYMDRLTLDQSLVNCNGARRV